jgi:hypothetical protein
LGVGAHGCACREGRRRACGNAEALAPILVYECKTAACVARLAARRKIHSPKRARVCAKAPSSPFPTETVYGIGANALDDFAVSRIFAAKQRPRFNPLIVHVLERVEAEELVAFYATALALAEAFWPGD